MARRKKIKPRRWVQKVMAKHRKGSLHRQLGLPFKMKIPAKILQLAAKASGKLGKRARLALTLRGFRR